MSASELEKLNQLKEQGAITEEEYQEAKAKILNGIGNTAFSTAASADTIPAEIKGPNWGAFFFTWIWGLSHNTWIALLSLIPAISLIMSFILLFKGNEWAWKNRHFSSVEEFKAVQKAWAIWGLSFVILTIVACIIIGITT